LISALTLAAFYGRPSGSVTLNGVPLTDKIFKQHCYVVEQHDKHWPYLTCRETLMYAAELYEIAGSKADLNAVVDQIIVKMGLTTSANTKNGKLSGGQRRRLSIGIALLKQPTLLFLDEPTSGLDAAAAANIMQEIVRVAKEERIIIVCTIHQPSTKVYNGFDQLMIMSRGREAFAGDVKDIIPYFDSVGYSCPPATNPAEFFLDLVNSDFSDEKAVTSILDTWEEKRPDNAGSSHHKKGFGDEDEDGNTGVALMKGTSLANELQIMFRRHFQLVVRDPILYLARLIMFLVSNAIFAFVYWKARENKQDQVINKVWIIIWFISVTTNLGVVAVFALNDEFKSILRESKNGMVTGASYVLAKSVLVLPIYFIMAVFALGIPQIAIQDTPKEAFGWNIVLFAVTMWVFESVAEALSVWFTDPILGMLQYMNYWFGAYLFGGFLIPLADMYWPFKLFYYVMPFSYFARSTVYNSFKYLTFEPCTDPATSAVCVPGTSGMEVLGDLGRVMPLFSNEDNVVRDVCILVGIGAFYKILYIIGALYKTSVVAHIHEK
jgi:ABC-type multidrug transport system ATPase subunit